MQNFSYYNPTRLVFGRSQVAALANLVPTDLPVLLLYGGGSIMRNGVHAQVRAALAKHTVREFGGIEPNPTYETLMRAVELLRAEGDHFLLAVGGGSVLDGTKFVAAAAPFAGDAWEIVSRRAPLARALPLGAVLTLPATGSEANSYAVVSRRETQQKLAFGHPLLFPRFSVLDPETTFSLPPRQVANGIVDAFTHVMEQYLTFPADAPLQDRMAEGVLRTLLEIAPRTLAEPADYASRASLMWCATIGLNGILGVGVPQDWATHAIGHELTALHGLDHGQTLAVVLPALLANRREGKRAKLLQYAERVWDLTSGSEDARVTAAIDRTRAFFESVGVRTRLADYGIGPDIAPVVAARLDTLKRYPLGERRDLQRSDVEAILRAA